MSRRSGLAAGFAVGFSGLEQYAAEVLVPFRRFEAEIHQLGVSLVTDLTLSQYGALFRERRNHAIILFSHWAECSIEFRDGPAGIASIVRTVPRDFAGIIDLCVCHPESLVPSLRASHPQSLIHSIGAQATPRFWLRFFRDLFILLRQRPRTYLEGTIAIREAYGQALGAPS